MKYSDRFLGAIGVESDNAIKKFAAECGVPLETLKLYNDANIVPSGKDLHAISKAAGISEFELMLKMGRLEAGYILRGCRYVLKLQKPFSLRYHLHIRFGNHMVFIGYRFFKGFSQVETGPKVGFGCIAYDLTHFSGRVFSFTDTAKEYLAAGRLRRDVEGTYEKAI